MPERASRTVIVVRGRVLEIPPARSAGSLRVEGSVAWWGALAALGGSLVVLGIFVGAALGAEAAIGGFLLFLATAVLVGEERYEGATALGLSGIIWMSAGISLHLGTDPSLVGSLAACELVGALVLVAGTLGRMRARARRDSPAAG